MSSPLAVWTAGLLALTAVGPNIDKGGTVTGLQVLPATNRTEVVISLDGIAETRDFTMEGPHRIVVDLMDSQSSFPDQIFEGVARGGIRNIRASQYSVDVVRIVLEVDEAVGYTLLTGDGYVRVSLNNPGEDFEPWSAPPAAESGILGATTNQTAQASLSPVAPSSAPIAPVAARSARWTGIQSTDTAEPITVSFTNTAIHDVLFTFADFTGRSIVPGSQVSGIVNAEIQNQPWDIALQAILESHGLAAQEAASGIIRVDRLEDLAGRELVEPLITRAFRVNYANAEELVAAMESLLSDRGRVTVSSSTNSLVVTDIPRVLESVDELVQGLDLRTPEITISAKIIFVNRTDLQEFGVVYDLKDSRGNQLNAVTPGLADFGEGLEEVEVGTDVVSLGGNSIAALGNANQRVVGPSLELLTSLVLGRHTLISFVEALQSVNLSDIQAAPQVRVLDNQQARILVGERTPIRVIDAAGGGAGAQPGAGVFPQATVQIEETGIVLEVTPHVTAGDLILMELRAERSGIEIAEADIGFIFNTQEAETRVLVEDGETVVIGGLTVTERTEVRNGIPLLQDLPLLGRFFRLTREQSNQRDLMILVTPQINRR